MEESAKNGSFVERIAVTAIMLAAATLLSFVKLADLPAGGSVTLASLLPILILAYRYGTPWGLLSGLIHGAVQFALGAGVLSYVTGWQSVVAVILLDYVVAFAVVGLAGLARRMTKSQPAAFLIGAFIGCAARYVCHVISGATVWAGLSIPDEAALTYSFIYNATYMLPEMLILMLVGYYVSSALDFRGRRLRALKDKDVRPAAKVLAILAGALLTGAAVFDVVAVFSKLQNADTGEFDFTNIVNVDWKWVIIVSAVAAAFAVVLFVIRHMINKREES